MRSLGAALIVGAFAQCDFHTGGKRALASLRKAALASYRLGF
jgi:hypothetical protein